MSQPARPRTIEPADLFRFRFLQGASLSPDGGQVAYVVSHVEDATGEEHSTIYLLDLATGESRRFTSGLYRDSNPRWSPDGRWIAFVSVRAGPPQIYIMASDGGEPRALTCAKNGVGAGPLWSPDGTIIAFTTGSGAKPRDPAKPYRVTRRVYRVDGMGYVEDALQTIHTVSVSGGESRRLAEGDYHQVPMAWSPDGKELLFLASIFPESVDHACRLRFVNLEGQVREILGDWGTVAGAAYARDGRSVVFSGTPTDRPVGSKVDLWVTNTEGATPRCRTTNSRAGVACGPDYVQPDMPVLAVLGTGMLITDDGSAILAQHTDGCLKIIRVPLAGPERALPLVTGDRCCLLFDGNGEHLLYAVSELNNPAELYICNLDGTNERRLTCINNDLLAQLKLPTTERLQVPGVDGVPVEAWLMMPPVGQGPYPTILYSHGGPDSAFGYVFSFDFQMLAGAGYAVLFVNFRGSRGYGDEFATRLNGDWGNLDYLDSMAAVDYVVGKGQADPERLGCCGISYGGYMSSWIVGQTNRFKASVPENPVTNLVTLYGAGDIPELVKRYIGGTPWEARDVYARCSPITYAHRCKTPTLLVQGEMDMRCPPDQSEQFYAVLKANGCVVEMLRIPGSTHAGTIAGPVAGRRAQNEALLGWMNRYVLGRA